MARALPVLFAICFACSGKGDDSSFPPPTNTGGTTDSTPTTGNPGGTPGGTAGGTPTGTTTVTPPTDFCPAWPAATGTPASAQPGDDLQAAIDALSNGDTLELQSGTYSLTAPLTLNLDGITIRSQSGNRGDVILDGGGVATSIFEVHAGSVGLVSMTLTHAFDNGVTILPNGADIADIQLYDLAIVDNAQFGVYMNADNNTFFADNGTIACSHIELTDAGRGDVRNGCRTAGIEAERVQGWTVTDTTAAGFWCENGSAFAAIRFWRGSRDTLIQRSRGENSRRGIVLGFGSDAIVRSYTDQPCGAGVLTQHYGGRVINSVAWANDGDLEASASGIEDGIGIESACEVQVLHNSVSIGDLASDGDIVHRYPNTSGIIANNLVHETVRRLDGSLADTGSNIENLNNSEWVSVSTGDMHLAPAATTPIGAGDPAYLADVPDDVDGQTRTDPPDAGMDERL